MAELDPRITVAVKSYGRAGSVDTLAVVPYATVWVPESQGEAYREHYGDRVVTIPDDADGNLCRKSNAILDRTPTPWVLILDDDISGIGMWEAGVRHWLDPDDIAAVINHGFDMADQLGVSLWGINQNMDPLVYDTWRPFNLLAPILGPFNGHLDTPVRYDERARGKDDYDYWLATICRDRKSLRFNKFHYKHDHGLKAGGFVAMRTLAHEQAGAEHMRKKWGDRIVHIGGAAGGRYAKGNNILNTKIHVPIPGT